MFSCAFFTACYTFVTMSNFVCATMMRNLEKLSGARVSAPDLRAGAALCIAGLATDGITIVDDIVYIQRGYERFEEKIRGIGGIIERVSTEREIQKFKLKVS